MPTIPDHFLDSVPIALAYLLLILGALIVYEAGYRIGCWWQRRTPDEKEGSTGMLVGSLLALLAFLLAFTIGMASSRYDTRRMLVLSEANAIGTTYLRAGYLPEPARTETQVLLRAYVPFRVNVQDVAQLAANYASSIAIHGQIWSIAEELARETPDSDVLAIYIESLNEMIDLQNSRLVAGIYARVPETVLYLLLIGSALIIGMVGYNAGLSRKRSLVSAVILIVVMTAVVSLVVDLDRPRDGLLTVSQQPLIDLQMSMNEP
ncbi:MAG TPA: hypothetical protein VER79_02005 [Candidatus Limnocylindrales bacterium]|nr:hypothetical protein [Candidatus Limnocylindrales bacterium]